MENVYINRQKRGGNFVDKLLYNIYIHARARTHTRETIRDSVGKSLKIMKRRALGK